jgi:hypothetical protein
MCVGVCHSGKTCVGVCHSGKTRRDATIAVFILLVLMI